MPASPPQPECRRAPTRLLTGLGLALAIALPSATHGQTRSIRFDTLSLAEGLSQSTVFCILQDSTGFIWLGTQDGLHRYDGYGFTVYKHDPREPASLPDSSIRALYEDDSGDLWIGTEGGLAHWRRAIDTFTSYRHDPANGASLSGNHVRSIHRDPSGDLWIGTFDSGLNRFDPAAGTFARFRHDPADAGSLGDDRIRALTDDRLGNLWIATRGGLSLFDRDAGTFIRYHHEPAAPKSLSDDRVLSLFEDRLGALWVGTFDGLQRMDRATGTFVRYAYDPDDPASLSENTVRVIFEDQAGRLWIGTDGGLNLFDREKSSFARYRHVPGDPNSLSNDRVASIFQDRGGVLWVGTWAGGVCKWDPATWQFSHHRRDPGDATGLSSDAVLAFAQDRSKRLWIGTHGGLDRLDRETGHFTHFRHDPDDPRSLSNNRITALLTDGQGDLWVGTQTGGLNRLRAARGHFERYGHEPSRPDSLAADGVTALLEDAAGKLWVGTFGGGLDQYLGDRAFAHFRHEAANPASLSNDRVSCLAEDPDGGLWVGTFGGGLNRLDRRSGSFQRLLHNPGRPESLSHDMVTALHVDLTGTLWVGTQGGGLLKLESLDRGGVFTIYSEREGLPNQSISGILSEGREALWVSTNRGLARFDLRDESFRSFDSSHGLQSNEFNFGASHQSPDGEMFFGGVNGFNAFYPDRIERHSTPPPVVLTSFLRFGQPADLGHPLQDLESVALEHGDHVFSFEFAALDFAAPQKNRYAYRLEGLTEGWIDWIELGNHRRVTFTDLDPGSYVLQVKAANHDGVWNEDGISLALTVEPPPWRSGWAYSLYALAVTCVATAALHAGRKRRRRRRVLKEARDAARTAETESRIKGEFLANMSHEIRTPMSGVIGMTELLLLSDLSEKQRDQLETIRVSGEALLDILNDILDYSKIESMKLELEEAPFDLRALIEEALTLMAPTAAGKGLDLGYWIDAGAPETVIGDSVRTRQVLMNLMSNGIKFTKTGGVMVQVSARAQGEGRYELHFAVADSGIGIAADRLKRLFKPFSQVDASTTRQYGGTGLGLAICKRLSELMGGRIWVDSTPGAGSTFHFTLVGKANPRPERSFLYRSDPHLAGQRVLIVDDNPAMRNLLSRQTDAWGMLSETVDSAAAAIERLDTGADVDLAIMDRELMQRDEVSWVKGWGRDGRFRHLPVVLLIPLAKNGDGSGAPGMSDYPELHQPIKPVQLFDVLTELAAMRPLQPEIEATAAAQPSDRATPRPLRILLAEDNPVNQVVAPAMLKQLGHESDLARNGIEVLEALESRRYDLVLMDVQMPEMDGFEATRRIHRRFSEAERPTIVAMTAHAMRGYQEKCMEAGMDDYISKPVTLVSLQAMLDRFEEGRTAAGDEHEAGREG